MKKNIAAGILVSLALVYLSVRGIPWAGVREGVAAMHWGFALPALAAMLLMQVFRSIRWGVILGPMEKIRQRTLFPITSVGFLAIVSLPARLGELARPYLISRQSGIRMSAALGTIFVERVFDGLAVLSLFALTPLLTPLPPWLLRSGAIFFALTAGLLAAMILLLLKRERALGLLRPLLAKLPAPYGAKLAGLTDRFVDGFQMITDGRRFLAVAALSLVIWVLDVFAIYILFPAFGLTLPVGAALVVMIILVIGIALPAAPGFIGNWHFACILALGLFGVAKTDALTFAILYHVLSLGVVIALGLPFLPFQRFSLADVRHQL